MFRGWHSRLILDHWTSGKLYAVDPWDNEAVYRNGYCVDPVGVLPNRKKIMSYARHGAEGTLAKYVGLGRCVILPFTSKRASKRFEAGALDWVYIDGRHYREGVQEDLECWYPLVRPGGVVAGHDYNDKPEHFFEVKETVNTFFAGLDEDVIELETTPVPSWYMIKP